MPQWSQLCTGLSVHRRNAQPRCRDYEINLKPAFSRRMQDYAALRAVFVCMLVSYITLAGSLAADHSFAAVVRAITLLRTSRGYFTITRQRCAP